MPRKIYGSCEETFTSITHDSYQIIIGDIGCLSIVLYDDAGIGPVKNTDYRISGPEGLEYSGTTDDEGYLFHPDVPIDDYQLTVAGITVVVPVVLNAEERHLQRIISYQPT